MSSVEQLIMELCPNGVRYVSVGELAEVGTGKSDRNQETLLGAYPLYVRSKEVLRTDTYEFDENAIVIPGEGGVGDIFHYVEGKYALHQRAYRISFTSSMVDAKFAFYYFQQHFKSYIGLKAVNATVTSIRKPMITDFAIPLPPLEVQTAIVGILDTFTALETDLEAELEARTKQLQHYLYELVGNCQDGTFVTIGELGKIQMCKRVMKDQTRVSGDVPFYKIGTFGRTPDAYISKHLYENFKVKYPYPNPNDILISASGTIGRLVIFDGNDAYFQDSNIIWIANEEKIVTNDYLYYLLQTLVWSTEGGTIARLYASNFAKMGKTVPSLARQREIVEILRPLDQLVHDDILGIPAELNSRRKQYEYYRDQLLTFEEA